MLKSRLDVIGNSYFVLIFFIKYKLSWFLEILLEL